MHQIPRFLASREGRAPSILTKDRDFVELVHRRGTPPQVIWITCGNTSNDEMMRVLDATFERACELLACGEAIVEIKG